MTGVQTCALPIWTSLLPSYAWATSIQEEEVYKLVVKQPKPIQEYEAAEQNYKNLKHQIYEDALGTLKEKENLSTLILGKINEQLTYFYSDITAKPYYKEGLQKAIGLVIQEEAPLSSIVTQGNSHNFHEFLSFYEQNPSYLTLDSKRNLVSKNEELKKLYKDIQEIEAKEPQRQEKREKEKKLREESEKIQDPHYDISTVFQYLDEEHLPFFKSYFDHALKLKEEVEKLKAASKDIAPLIVQFSKPAKIGRAHV